MKSSHSTALFGVLIMSGLLIGAGAGVPTTAQPAPTTQAAASTRVTGKLVVPAELESFTGRTLETLLYEYDPRLADARATRIDQVVIKPFTHEKGKETSLDLEIGKAGTLNPSRRYYVTAFVLDGETRTHIGEVDGKPGLANVLVGGYPSDIRLVFRAVR